MIPLIRGLAFFALLSSSILLPVAGVAEDLPEKVLPLDGRFTGEAAHFELSWPKASGAKIGPISIERRELGETFTESWREIATARSFTRIFVDDSVEPGVAYEYRVSRPSSQKIENGYWVSGRELPAREKQGIAILVVDETLSETLAEHLQRFMQDLVGAGWAVKRRDVARGDDKNPVANLKAARQIRSWIQSSYYASPDESIPHALILVGHVPVVKSGRSKPDGHDSRALESDLFYADTNGVWRDNKQGVLLHNTIPSDHIEMQVGRIDFSGLDKSLGGEVSLLKSYFDRNHAWRHGQLGDLRVAYGGNNHLLVETNGLRNIVGPGQLEDGGHHELGTRQPWLFGVDFGSWKFSDYFAENSIKTVFSINFGSGKLNFSKRNNTMKAMLAQQEYGLATGWGGRPSWQLHHMALGRSIGYSHLRTVNNGTKTFGGMETREYTPTGNYPFINPIWVNLLGDPTLQAFPLPSVENLRAESSAGKVILSWTGKDSGQKTRYRIYRSSERYGPYRVLNPDGLLEGNRFVDEKPLPGSWYMVRAHAKKQVYAGSFFRFSEGAFVLAGE